MSDIPRVPLLIGGELVQSETKEWRDVIDPATQEVVARVPFATPAEVERAVANSKEAFKTWRNTSQAKRRQIMVDFAQLLREHTPKIAEVISREHGKTLPDAEGEVARGLEGVDHAVSANTMQLGDYAENAATGIDVYSVLQY